MFTVPSSPPQNVMVTTVNPASLMVSWQPPPVIDLNGPLNGHVIRYSRVGSSDMMNDVVTSGTTHTISGVVAYSNYSVKVTAVNDQGTGPFSNPVIQVSGEDGRSYDYQLTLRIQLLIWRDIQYIDIL